LVLLAFQSSVVGIYASVPTKSDNALAEVVHLVAVIGLVILSPREHYRSVSPSSYLVIYLSTRTLLNLSALLLVHERGFMTIQALRTIIEVGNLIAESQNKGHLGCLDMF
jgi:ATP-binding cassette subfamily C (CFTR/MRP) protein 1